MSKHQKMSFIKDFGFLFYIRVVILKIARKIFPRSLKAFFYEREHSLKKHKLKKILSPIADKLKTLEKAHGDGRARIPKKIWIFWWQGNHNEIPLIKFCIDSVERNKPHGVELIVLTKENLDMYCSIDDTIMKKLKSGVITLTHFSDIVRVSVLAEQGGLWLDATIFAASDFSPAFREGIWSIRRIDIKQKYVPKGRWSIYAIAAPKDCNVFVLMREIFVYYWSFHSAMLDYFLVDFCIDFLYESFSEIRNLFEAIPENNPQVLGLQKELGEPFSPDTLAKLAANTHLFKLSWKEKIPLERNGRVTMLGWLLETNNSIR